MIWIWVAPLAVAVVAAYVLFHVAISVTREALELEHQVRELRPILGELQELGDRSRSIGVAMAESRQRYNRRHG